MKKVILLKSLMAVFSAILLISLNVIATPKKVACAKAAYYNAAVVMAPADIAPAPDVPDVSTCIITAPADVSQQMNADNKTANQVKQAYTNTPKDKAAIKKDASSNFNNSSGIQKADVSNTTSNCGKNSVNNDTGQANKNLVNTQLSVAETVMPDVVQLK